MKRTLVLGSTVLGLAVLGLIVAKTPGYLSERRVSVVAAQIDDAHAALPAGGALCGGFPAGDVKLGDAQAVGASVFEKCDATIVRTRVGGEADCQRLVNAYAKRGVSEVMVNGIAAVSPGNPKTNFAGILHAAVLEQACQVSEKPVVNIVFFPSAGSMSRYVNAHAQEIAQRSARNRVLEQAAMAALKRSQ